MNLIRESLVLTGLAAIITLGACGPAAGPASPTPSGRALTPVAPFGPTTAPAPATTPGGVAPVRPGAVSMGEMGQMMSQLGTQLSQMMGGQPPASQMQQMMDLVASFSGQMAQGVMQAPEGTPEMRLTMSQNLRQMSDMAQQLRDRLAQMTPVQQQEATREMVRLTGEMGQTMTQIQGLGPQPSQADQQQVLRRMDQMQSSMNGLISQYGLLPLPAKTPAGGAGR